VSKRPNISNFFHHLLHDPQANFVDRQNVGNGVMYSCFCMRLCIGLTVPFLCKTEFLDKLWSLPLSRMYWKGTAEIRGWRFPTGARLSAVTNNSNVTLDLHRILFTRLYNIWRNTVTRFSGNEMETKTGKAYANPAREMLCGFFLYFGGYNTWNHVRQYLLLAQWFIIESIHKTSIPVAINLYNLLSWISLWHCRK